MLQRIYSECRVDSLESVDSLRVDSLSTGASLHSL